MTGLLPIKILSEKSRLSSVFWKMSGMMKLLYNVCSYHSLRLWYDEASCIIPDNFQITDEDLDFDERIFIHVPRKLSKTELKSQEI